MTDSIKASNAITHIAAIADGQEKTVQLPRTRYDSALVKSIICKERANATKGLIKSTSPVSLVDSTGQSYISRSSVNVRWHVEGSAQSFSETFHIVDSCGPCDAMLRKNIVNTDTTTPHAYPFMLEKQTKPGEGKQSAQEQKELQDLKLREAKAEAARRVRDRYERDKRDLKKSRQ